jgi:hypothetical protein
VTLTDPEDAVAKPPRTTRWWFFRILRGAAFVYVVYALALFLMQRALIFPTWLIPNTPRPALPPTAEVWTRDLGAGQSVEAFLLPGTGASTAAQGPAVLFFHGNGERIDDWVAPLEPYVNRGVTVLMVDRRTAWSRTRSTSSNCWPRTHASTARGWSFTDARLAGA